MNIIYIAHYLSASAPITATVTFVQVTKLYPVSPECACEALYTMTELSAPSERTHVEKYPLSPLLIDRRLGNSSPRGPVLF